MDFRTSLEVQEHLDGYCNSAGENEGVGRW